MNLFVRIGLFLSCTSLAFRSFGQDFALIQKQLEEINQLDQKYRIVLDSLTTKRNLKWNDPQIQNILPIAAYQDSINLIAVLQIIDKHGWLGISQVGKKANQTLFLIVQHADSNVLTKYFPLLVKSYELGETPGRYYATMLDRILIDKGQKQLYGTQIQMEKQNGQFVLFPIESESSVDIRRKKAGLMPLATFKKSLNR